MDKKVIKGRLSKMWPVVVENVFAIIDDATGTFTILSLDEFLGEKVKITIEVVK